GGANPISNSTTQFQLVIDAANQKNVYSTTAGYATQLLNGITSAVTVDATGWWLEMRLQKSATSPVIPAGGLIGIDFNYRDNDSNNNAALSTVYDWNDNSTGASFPTKIPNKWGKASLPTITSPSTSPAGPVTNFVAQGASTQAVLSWTNPSDCNFTGTM